MHTRGACRFSDAIRSFILMLQSHLPLPTCNYLPTQLLTCLSRYSAIIILQLQGSGDSRRLSLTPCLNVASFLTQPLTLSHLTQRCIHSVIAPENNATFFLFLCGAAPHPSLPPPPFLVGLPPGTGRLTYLSCTLAGPPPLFFSSLSLSLSSFFSAFCLLHCSSLAVSLFCLDIH